MQISLKHDFSSHSTANYLNENCIFSADLLQLSTLFLGPILLPHQESELLCNFRNQLRSM
jgi:hypothetical protein